MLVIMTDKTLDVIGIHLSSLLRNWPDETGGCTVLPSFSLGAAEGLLMFCHRQFDPPGSYSAAIFDSLGQYDSDSGTTLYFDIVYIKGDRYVVLPIKAEVGRDGV